MNRAKWLAKRETPPNLWRRLGRWIWCGGTYVRERRDAAENIRLAKYQNMCNGNFVRKRQ